MGNIRASTSKGKYISGSTLSDLEVMPPRELLGAGAAQLTKSSPVNGSGTSFELYVLDGDAYHSLARTSNGRSIDHNAGLSEEQMAARYPISIKRPFTCGCYANVVCPGAGDIVGLNGKVKQIFHSKDIAGMPVEYIGIEKSYAEGEILIKGMSTKQNFLGTVKDVAVVAKYIVETGGEILSDLKDIDILLSRKPYGQINQEILFDNLLNQDRKKIWS